MPTTPEAPHERCRLDERVARTDVRRRTRGFAHALKQQKTGHASLTPTRKVRGSMRATPKADPALLMTLGAEVPPVMATFTTITKTR